MFGKFAEKDNCYWMSQRHAEYPPNAVGHCWRPWGDLRINCWEHLGSYILLARNHLADTYRTKEDNFS